jgi:hypothetical protein
MPIRTASLNKEIHKNGARLHQAMMARMHSQGADSAASDEEQALLEERQHLKEAKAQRLVQAQQPKPKAARVTKEAKPPKEPKAPKAAKEAKEPKAAKSAKGHISRAEKHAKKAEALEAAKRASKKSAKT